MTIEEIVNELQGCIERSDRSRAEAIGNLLNKAGGMELMQSVHAAYSQKYGYANGGNPRLLDGWWNGIGEWLG